MGEVEQGTPPTPPTKSLTMGKKAEKSSLHLQWKAFSFTTCPLPASPPGRLPLNYVECLCLRPWPGHKVPGWLGPAFAYTFASRPSAEGSVSKKKCLVFKNSDWVLKWESERNILLDLNYLREGRNKVLSCCGLSYWSSVNVFDIQDEMRRLPMTAQCRLSPKRAQEHCACGGNSPYPGKAKRNYRPFQKY